MLFSSNLHYFDRQLILYSSIWYNPPIRAYGGGLASGMRNTKAISRERIKEELSWRKTGKRNFWTDLTYGDYDHVKNHNDEKRPCCRNGAVSSPHYILGAPDDEVTQDQ